MKKGWSATDIMKHTRQLRSSGDRPKVRCHRSTSIPGRVASPACCDMYVIIFTRARAHTHTHTHTHKYAHIHAIHTFLRTNVAGVKTSSYLVADLERRQRLFCRVLSARRASGSGARGRVRRAVAFPWGGVSIWYASVKAHGAQVPPVCVCVCARACVRACVYRVKRNTRGAHDQPQHRLHVVRGFRWLSSLHTLIALRL